MIRVKTLVGTGLVGVAAMMFILFYGHYYMSGVCTACGVMIVEVLALALMAILVTRNPVRCGLGLARSAYNGCSLQSQRAINLVAAVVVDVLLIMFLVVMVPRQDPVGLKMFLHVVGGFAAVFLSVGVVALGVLLFDPPTGPEFK